MLYKNHIYIFILKFIQYHFFENQFLLKTVKVHTIFIHLKNDKIFEIVTVSKEDNMQKWSYIDWKSWIPTASRSWETWKVNPAWYTTILWYTFRFIVFSFYLSLTQDDYELFCHVIPFYITRSISPLLDSKGLRSWEIYVFSINTSINIE